MFVGFFTMQMIIQYFFIQFKNEDNEDIKQVTLIIDSLRNDEKSNQKISRVFQNLD